MSTGISSVEHSPDRQSRLTELKGGQDGLAPWDLARCNNHMDFFSSSGNCSGGIGTPENLRFLKYLLHRDEGTKITQGRDGDGLPHMTTEAVLSTSCLCLPLSLSTFTALPIHSQQKAQIAPELPLSRKHYRYSFEPRVIQLGRAASASRALLRRTHHSSQRCLLPAGAWQVSSAKLPFLPGMQQQRRVERLQGALPGTDEPSEILARSLLFLNTSS